jgi:hypothetical protein
MVKTFKPVISANFLKMIEDSRVGKALIEVTGFSAYKMLTRFSLNLPTLSNPTGWSLDCYDVKFNYNQPDVILFLKYAWLYSETETNEHIDNLLHSVAQDITGFEKDLLIEEGEKKVSTSALILRKQEEIIVETKEKARIYEEELLKSHSEIEAQKLQSSLMLQKHEETIVKSEEENKIQQEKLIKFHSEIEAQKTQMTQQELNIKFLSCKLDAKLKKEKKISLTNSESASKTRGCEEVDTLLKELVRNNSKKKPNELWALISWERDGSELYKENDKINHEGCSCREFGISAFYARIQKINEEFKKNSS